MKQDLHYQQYLPPYQMVAQGKKEKQEKHPKHPKKPNHPKKKLKHLENEVYLKLEEKTENKKDNKK